jgi:hypothetical protein
MKTLKLSSQHLFPLILLFFVLVTSTPQAQPPDPVKTRLNALSIDTTISARTIPDPNNPSTGILLTDAYAPLGNTYTINKITELGLLNLGLQSSPQTKFSLFEDLAKVASGGNAVLIGTDPVSHHVQLTNYERRAGTYGDIDGDGIDEILLVYQVLDTNDNTRKLHLQVLSRTANTPFVSTLVPNLLIESSTPLNAPAGATRKSEFKDFAIAVGNIDFTNNSVIGTIDNNRNELIIAICCNTDYTQTSVPFQRRVDVRAYQIVRPDPSLPNLVKSEIVPFQRFLPNLNPAKVVYPKLAVGSVDADSGHEVALVLNERTQDPSNDISDDGVARYVVIDDKLNNYLQINAGAVQGSPGGGPTKSAILADVTVSDVDADGYDEILFGGLTGFTSDCVEAVEHILVTVEDALNDFANQPGKAGLQQVSAYGGCGNGADNGWYYRTAHIDAFDINGDEVKEVQFNGMVFTGWKGGTPWTKIYEIGISAFANETETRFLDSNSAITVGDYNGDGNEDLIYYTPLSGGVVRILGIKPGMTNVELLDTKDVEPGADFQFRPALLMPNVDTDATILRYLNHQLYFSEPIIVAVMAAAPCNESWGQDPDNCRTSFGVSTQQETEVEKKISLNAGVTVGFAFEDPLSLIGIEVSAAVDTLLEQTRTTSYSRTDTTTWTTGAIEDSVIFTSIPIDRYTYALVTCNSEDVSVDFCDPDDVDQYVFNVDLPRKPQTRQTQVSTYNAFVPSSQAVHIGPPILDHVAGDPSSYKTEAEKNDILLGQCCQSASSSTGEGTSFKEVEIEIGNRITQGTAYEVNYSFDFQATTAGVLTGFTVGFGSGESLQISTGSSVIYKGTVSDHDSPNWTAYTYEWGIFSYVFQANVPGATGSNTVQEFQVLDYWTAPPFSGWPPTPTPDPNATATSGPEPTVQGPPPGSIELLINNSVELDDNDNKQPDKWKGKNLSSGDKLKCNKPAKDKILAHSGECAFAFKGTGTKAKLEQNLKSAALAPYSLIAGDVMRAAIYGNGKSIPTDASVFKIKVKYVDPNAGANGDGKDKLKLSVSLTVEGVYQPFEQTLTLANVPSNIKAQIQFKAPSGKLYVDDMSISVPIDSSLQLIPLP